MQRSSLLSLALVGSLALLAACAASANEDAASSANDLTTRDAGVAPPLTPVQPNAADGESCRYPLGLDVRACQRGLACTYVWGADHGTCTKPGTEGGLCGATYADFGGGDCADGLRCALDTAAFPGTDAHATTRGSNVGLCQKQGVEGAACTTAWDAPADLRCNRGLACTYAQGATRGSCRTPGTLGGLCGATYADFSGSECTDGLRCAEGKATFASGTSDEPATYHPTSVGLCEGASDAGSP